jgi:hypothetical protein
VLDSQITGTLDTGASVLKSIDLIQEVSNKTKTAEIMRRD